MPPRKRPTKKNGEVIVIGGNSSTGLKTPLPDLNKWLTRNRDISDCIIFERPSTALALSTVAAWRDWNSEERKLLSDAFARAWAGKLSTDKTPYPNLVTPLLNDAATTIIDPNTAIQHYMETVACCMMLELSEMRFSWSLTKLTEQQKRFLLDSRSLFKWDETHNTKEGSNQPAMGYLLEGNVLPARPGYMLKFLADEKIINRASQKQTVVNMVGWCGRLYHYAGNTAQDFYNHWQYLGVSPISRVIEGTIRTKSDGTPLDDHTSHWTAGCHGTTGLMSNLLRLINIPVETSVVCDHALPKFSSVDYWLSHGDDPYMLKFHPNVTAEQLLIDKTTFDAWFGPDVPNACDNVSRRSKELAAEK